jgi:hypothetical protein
MRKSVVKPVPHEVVALILCGLGGAFTGLVIFGFAVWWFQ